MNEKLIGFFIGSKKLVKVILKNICPIEIINNGIEANKAILKRDFNLFASFKFISSIILSSSIIRLYPIASIIDLIFFKIQIESNFHSGNCNVPIQGSAETTRRTRSQDC